MKNVFNVENLDYYGLKMQNFLSSLASLAHMSYLYLFCQGPHSQAVNNSFKNGVHVVQVMLFCRHLN